MKKSLIIITIVFILGNSYAQEASVEKSIFGIQTGFLGIWAHNETKLANSIALRSELGFDAAIFAGSSDATDFALFPTITIEPRYYYSLKKRFEKGKNTTNNSANFITMRISYQSDAFSISSVDEDIRILNNISFLTCPLVTLFKKLVLTINKLSLKKCTLTALIRSNATYQSYQNQGSF